ncbi:MAG: ABC transporter ATP-binding protein [Candidatus Sifarchaeia archaeon]
MGHIRRLIGYSLRRRRLFFGFLAAAAIGTFFNLLTPLVIVEIVDGVLLAEQLELLLSYTLLYVGLGVLYAIFDMVGRYGSAISSQWVIYELREELFESLMEKDLAFYDENETGQLLARVTTDVSTMKEFLFWGYRVLFIGTVQLIGTYLVMWNVNPDLTYYMFLLFPVIVIFIYSFAKRVRPVFRAAREQYGVLSSVLAENVVGHKVVRAFASEEREAKRVEKENRGFQDLRVEASRLQSFFQPMLPAIFGLAIGGLIYVGGVSILDDALTLGEFVGFVTLVGMLMLPARFLSWGVGMYQRAAAAGDRTFYILDSVEEVIDPENPIDASHFEGRVDFDNVYFSYRGEKHILKDISLHVKPGQVVALLGGTGSGKTSLVNLIPRFYDVDNDYTVTYNGATYRVHERDAVSIDGSKHKVIEDHIEIDGERVKLQAPGTVCINGVDIRLYALDDLRKRIGIVHQDPFLFSASLKENIAFGRPSASMEEVIEAAKAAMIHDFIMTLEAGYDTEVGERGVTLSGGQKQRVAIARALLADPRILILDDSTSSVDARTEMLIQQALENLMEGRTTFIITHRLSTVRNADLIVMMERGQIVEIGTHEELLATEGLYYSIHQTLTEIESAVDNTSETVSVSTTTSIQGEGSGE